MKISNASEARSRAMTGIEAFLTVLAAAGVKHIFGNPGTTELPLNDALVRRSAFPVHLRPAGNSGAGDGGRLRDGVGRRRRGQRAYLLRPRQRDGHALQRPLRRQSAAADGRTAGSPAALRGAGTGRRHGERRAAVDEVGRRGAARRGCADGRPPGHSDGAHAADRAGLPRAACRRADGGMRGTRSVAAVAAGSPRASAARGAPPRRGRAGGKRKIRRSWPAAA